VPVHDSPALRSVLRTLRGAHDELVLGGVRERVSGRVWKRLMERAGIEGVRVNDLRKTAVSAVISGSLYPEALLEARFGHSRDVSSLYYRRAQAQARGWGDTVEAWLGAEAEIQDAIKAMRQELARRGGLA